MRVDWCVSSWFRIKNTHSLTRRSGVQLRPFCHAKKEAGEEQELLKHKRLSRHTQGRGLARTRNKHKKNLT